MGALERENVELKLKMNTLQNLTELLKKVLSAQMISSVHYKPTQVPSQTFISHEPPHMPIPVLPEL